MVKLGKMHKKKRMTTVMQKLMISYIILISFIVIITAGYRLISGINTLNQEFDEALTDFSYLLSRDSKIREMVKSGVPDQATTLYLDEMLERFHKVDIIVVADENAIRLFHPEKERIGRHFVGGDEEAILSGADPYVTEGVGTRQFQRRSFAGIIDDNGTVIGFVMVSAYGTSISEMQSRIFHRGIVFAIVSFFFAFWLAKNIKKSLLGYEPDQIANLYLQKENHIVSALRANTHEYVNKLHVILGLLQMGDTETAMDYIEHVKEEEKEDYSLVMKRIENRTIAALIMGKKRRAKERDIKLTLRKDSYLEAHNDYLSVNDLVTIIGNLLENAMDAIEEAKETKEISLFIGSFKEGLTILVDDTGSGMTSDVRKATTTGGYSTKGEGRGTGLWLIQEIVKRCRGTMEIESEPGVGSSFTISIHRKRRRQPVD